MAARGGVTAIMVAVIGFGLAASPASAQGIFERIFGGLRHAVEAPARAPAVINAFADPSEGNPSSRPDNGPARAFCVRSCDVRFFPVQAHAGQSAAEACHAFCPASETRLYSGSNIDYAMARDGSRYADLDNAFVYRKQLVPGCTCNGRDQFGLAPVNLNADPTLRPGDVVATGTGMVAVTRGANNVAAFTPVDAAGNLPKATRDKMSGLKVAPAPANATPITIPIHYDDNRSAQR